MQITATTIAAAYRYLKDAAFYDMDLPSGVKFVARPMRDYYGMYYPGVPRLEVNSKIKRPGRFLKIVAHEMCHAVLSESGGHRFGHWDGDHGQQFKELAAIVCDRMGWRRKSF